jgi:endonuclease/exonuclease/phosphatase family metal-dependent hydrolase
MSVGRLAGALALAAAALGGGCVSNYLDPAGPFYATTHGDGRDREPGLRVVTFNVERGRRVERAIAALQAHPELRGADVIALQEMSADGVEALARALRMNSVYFPASREPGGGADWGNAILSPWPLEDARKLLLPHRSLGSRRARTATRARLLRPAGALRVYSTHLGSVWGTTEARRRDQAEVILADAAAAAEPVVIAGDFNSRELGRLFVGQGYCWPTRDVGPTVDRHSVDHVFARGLCAGPAAPAGVARDVADASDHRPVWTVLGAAR